MSEKDSGSKLTLSRRKALASLGTIGAATAAGGFATYAQFTDNEDVDITFSTGEIDGSLAYSATYNGKRIKEMGANGGSFEHPHVKEGVANGVGAGANIVLDDVKPGDYGSILFEIGVDTNPAWLINCLGVGGTVTEITYPDSEDPTSNPAEYYGNLLGELVDTEGGGWVQNDLGDLLMLIPFYDEDDTSMFFDSEGPESLDPASRYGVGTPGAFWSNEQDDDDGRLNPLTFNQAIASSGINTALWPDGNVLTRFGEDYECETGCFLLHGQMAGLSGGESADNTPDPIDDVAPLQPGSTMYFGYDWHLPWEVGNYAQDVTFDFNVGFSFVQERHSAGSTFPNMYQYDPEDVDA